MTSDAYDVYYDTTEWEDALAKHKIIPKHKKATKQDVLDTKKMWEEKEKDPYAEKSLEDLQELEDEIDEDHLKELRRQRILELQKAAELNKFGRIKQISKPEYTAEVTESSVQQPVVCCLFVHGQEESRLMLDCLDKLAAKFKSVKFVKIVGQECIPNYKDAFCPTLVIYKDGDPIGNIKGLFNFGGKKLMTADIVEWELAKSTGIWKTTIEENPRQFKLKKMGGNKKYTIVKKSKDAEDSDSDSDLDLD